MPRIRTERVKEALSKIKDALLDAAKHLSADEYGELIFDVHGEIVERLETVIDCAPEGICKAPRSETALAAVNTLKEMMHGVFEQISFADYRHVVEDVFHELELRYMDFPASDQ